VDNRWPPLWLAESAAEGTRRWQHLATASTLLTISLLVDEDTDTVGRVPFPLRSEEEIRKAVLLAARAGRPTQRAVPSILKTARSCSQSVRIRPPAAGD
jgi:hypothetical protein